MRMKVLHLLVLLSFLIGLAGPAFATVCGGGGTGGCISPTAVESVLLYNANSNVMQYCDGTNWRAMGPSPGTGGAGCAVPAGSLPGKMLYNSDFNVMQFCDGTNWVAMGPWPGTGGAGCTG